MKGIPELFRELGMAALWDTVIKPWFDKHGADAVDKAVQAVAKSIEECRTELVAFYDEMNAYNPVAARRFTANRLRWAANGSENLYMQVLSKLWKDLDGTEVSRQLRDTFLQRLQMLPRTAHDSTIEALNHDPVQEFLRQAWQNFNIGATRNARALGRLRRRAERTWMARGGTHARQNFLMRLIRG